MKKRCPPTLPRIPPEDVLDRLFHEPNRLAIMSALCGSDEDGLAFTELRHLCNLTDGNLNRHLNTLEAGGMVAIEKQFVDRKPLTTVRPTATGIESFAAYLAALEAILKKAKAALPREAAAKTSWAGHPAKA